MNKAIGIKISFYDVKVGNDLYAIKFEDVNAFENIEIGDKVEITYGDEYAEIETFRKVD